MSLRVDTRDSKTTVHPYDAGVTLMCLGLSEINEKNVRQAQARIEFINALDLRRWKVKTIPHKAADLIGVKANVTNETLSRWAARISKSFLIDAERWSE